MPIGWRLGFCLEGVKTGQGAVNSQILCHVKKNAALPQNQYFLKRKEKKLVKKLFDFQLKKKKMNAHSH